MKIGPTLKDRNPSTVYPKFFSERTRHKAGVFISHFFFRDDLAVTDRHTYINIVRHPVKRVISSYFYMRNEEFRPKLAIMKLRASGHWNESLRDCVMNQHPGCYFNEMTRFFCSPHEICKTGSPQALQRAKFNILKHYAAIGTTEHLADFVEVLKVRLPRFFHDSGSLESVKVNPNPNYMNVIDESTRQLIWSRNQADAALYSFAEELSRKQMQLCKQADHET